MAAELRVGSGGLLRNNLALQMQARRKISKCLLFMPLSYAIALVLGIRTIQEEKRDAPTRIRYKNRVQLIHAPLPAPTLFFEYNAMCRLWSSTRTMSATSPLHESLIAQQ